MLRDRSITHSLQRRVSTKSSISQLECILIFYNIIFSDDTRIRTNEYHAHGRTVYLLVDHKVTVALVFFSALLTVSSFYKYHINAFFMSIKCILYYFVDDTGIRAHAHQAQKQTVYPLDHKVTMSGLVDSPNRPTYK